MTPFFMERLLRPHAALCGQFLVVYALLLYFKVADGQKQRRTFVLFTLLLAVALLIHVYLFAMVAAIYCCAVVNAAIHPGRSWRDLGVGILGTAAAVAATILVAGHVSQSMYLTASLGFGHYSMNLLAPVASPHHSFLYYRSLDATGGQFDGFNYWGIGIILLLCAGMPVLLKNCRMLLNRRLWPLTLGLLALTLFALSNQVYLGHQRILSFDLPGPLFSLADQFRSSGRFFWVVSYAVMALAVCSGLSVRRRWAAAVLVIAAVGLQLADTGSMRNGLRQVANVGEERPVAEERWNPILSVHQLVVLLPPTQCGGSRNQYTEIGRIAAESGVAFHSVWAGRYNMASLESCRALNKDVLDNGFRPGVLYLVDTKALRSFRQRPELKKFCSQLEGRTLCTLQRAELNLPPLAQDSGLALWPSDTTRFSALELADFLGIGWSYMERSGVWSLGYQSELFFRLPSCEDATSLRVKILPFVGHEGQTVTLSANGGEPVIRHYSEPNTENLVIPIGTCDTDDPIIAITFLVDKPVSTLETGESGDARPLGLHLMEAELLQ